MAGVKFEDNSAKVIDAMDGAIREFLEWAGGRVEKSVKRNSRVRTGQTAGSFRHVVDESKNTVTIGSDMENAIWEEFGTGIHALNGDGRKDVPWHYQADDGKWYTTSGKKPSRALQRSFDSNKSKIKSEAKKQMGTRLK